MTPATQEQQRKPRKRIAGFEVATREKLRLRMVIDGPSGAGKTVTALRCAHALANRMEQCVVVIDTEHGSARKYQGEDYGEGPFDFQVKELNTFSPATYTTMIEMAAQADVIVIDSLTHAWDGKDGALELVDKLGKGTGWKDVTPMHRRMIEAILHSPAHVISTMRSRSETVIQQNDKGKAEPIRVGTKAVQRDGMEFEFDICMSMDLANLGSITKSRCSALNHTKWMKPGADFMTPVIEWLERGTQPAERPEYALSVISDQQVLKVSQLYQLLGMREDTIKKELIKLYRVTEIFNLTADQGKELELRLEAQARRKGKLADANKEVVDSKPATQPKPATSTTATPSVTNPELPKTKNVVAAPDASQSRNDHPRVVELRRIFKVLASYGMSEEVRQKILFNRNAPSEVDLSDEQIEEVIAMLENKMPKTVTPAGSNGNHTNGNGSHTNGNGKGGTHNTEAAANGSASASATTTAAAP